MDVLGQLQQSLGDAYVIDRELGGGGMSRVFLARERSLDRLIVIKLLPQDAAATVSADRFRREINVAARLQHPHIVPLLSSGQMDGLPFYTMPFVEGESLRARITREGELPIDETVQILKEVARALAYAHEHGIVHRDIKPDNVMISGGASMVTDFGVAKAVTESAASPTSAGLTLLGVALGTPAYMAPEQATGDGNIDHRADIYALGCMAYELLTGRPPFTGSSAQSLLAAQVTEAPDPVQKRRPTIPPELAAIVMHCLEKRPADRPKNAADVLRGLETVVVTPHSTSAYTATRARAAGRTHASWLRDPRTIGLAFLAVVAAAFGTRGLVNGPDSSGDASVFSMLTFIDGTVPDYERGFALSPDGSKVLFVARTADSTTATLWVRSLNSHIATPLPGTASATYPFWSPDGRQIGYFANGQLRIRTLSGSEDRALCPARTGEGASWGSRNIIVFAPDVRGTIWAVDANGGGCRSITTLDSGVLDHRRPSFLTDGHHFVFGSGSAATIFVGDVDTKEQRVLLRGAGYGDYVEPGYLFFFKGKLFAQRLNTRTLKLEGDAAVVVDEQGFTPSARPLFSARRSTLLSVIQRTSPRTLVRLARDGSVTSRYVFDAKVGAAQDIQVSHDGSRVAVAGNGVWLYDVERDAATMLVAGNDSGAVHVNGLTWAPGDSAITYTPTAGADLGIRVHNFRTGTDRSLIQSPSTALFVDAWSKDGRSILFHAADILVSSWPVSLYDVGSGKSEPILANHRVLRTTFSADGQWIAYSSTESGRSEIYLMSMRTRIPIRVTRDGGQTPQWRGRELFYRTSQVGLMAVTVDLADRPRIGTPRIGTPRIVIPDPTYGAMSVSADGQTIYALRSETRRALALVQNWPARLK